MYTRLIRMLLLCCICSSSRGQLNESDSLRLQGKAALTGNIQRGNVDLLLVRSRLEFTVVPFRHFVFKSQNSSLYQEFSGRKADYDLFSRNYLYYQPKHIIYPFAISYLSSNFRRKVSSRFFAGAGITVQVLRRPGHSIKISGSTVYEESRFRGNQFNVIRYSGSNRISVWRSTTYIAGSHQFFNRRLRLNYDAYWQPVWGYAVNNRTQLDLGLEFPFWKGLSGTIQYSATREAVGLNGVRKTDRILSFGVNYAYSRR